MPAKIITPDSQLRRIQRRLEALELQHLREFIQQQQARIEYLEDEVRRADDNAEYWRQSWFETAEEFQAETGAALGMTKDGQIGLIDRRDSLIRRIAAMNPEAGEIGPGMLAMIVSEARELVGDDKLVDG